MKVTKTTLGQLPRYTLLALWQDDSMDVICHYHRKPTHGDLRDMAATYRQMVKRVPRKIILSKTYAEHHQSIYDLEAQD